MLVFNFRLHLFNLVIFDFFLVIYIHTYVYIFVVVAVSAARMTHARNTFLECLRILNRYIKVYLHLSR